MVLVLSVVAIVFPPPLRCFSSCLLNVFQSSMLIGPRPELISPLWVIWNCQLCPPRKTCSKYFNHFKQHIKRKVKVSATVYVNLKKIIPRKSSQDDKTGNTSKIGSFLPLTNGENQAVNNPLLVQHIRSFLTFPLLMHLGHTEATG